MRRSCMIGCMCVRQLCAVYAWLTACVYANCPLFVDDWLHVCTPIVRRLWMIGCMCVRQLTAWLTACVYANCAPFVDDWLHVCTPIVRRLCMIGSLCFSDESKLLVNFFGYMPFNILNFVCFIYKVKNMSGFLRVPIWFIIFFLCACLFKFYHIHSSAIWTTIFWKIFWHPIHSDIFILIVFDLFLFYF